MAPFLAATRGKAPSLRYFRDLDPANNRDSLPLIPQLLGRDGGDFREVANRIHDALGYDEVNWNAGCPAPTVTTRGRGCGILPFPDRVDAFLEAACTGLRCRLSVKIRLGLARDDEYLALVEVLNRYPIREVTIHPRTGRQLYGGRADVERFADFKARLRHPVAYNGDLETTAGARAICARFPDLSSLMIGRGLIANPWLPAAIRAGTPERDAFDRRGLARFHDDLYAAYRDGLEGGPGPVLAKMKELWGYWGGLGGGVKRVLKSRSFVDFEEAAARALEGSP
jgi:tRNA-dihydrouridine synthase